MNWFLGALGLLFIFMKGAGLVTWPWFWVLAPIWGPAVLWLVVSLAIWLILRNE